MKTLLATLLLVAATAAHAQPYAVLGASSVDGATRPYMAAGWQRGPVAIEASTLRTSAASGYGLAVLGKVPIGAWSVLGKVGAYSLKAANVGGDLGAVPVAGPHAGHETHAVLGLGVAYRLSDVLQLRALIERIDGDVLERERVFTAGLVVRFP
jgi:hypothetical protein